MAPSLLESNKVFGQCSQAQGLNTGRFHMELEVVPDDSDDPAQFAIVSDFFILLSYKCHMYAYSHPNTHVHLHGILVECIEMSFLASFCGVSVAAALIFHPKCQCNITVTQTPCIKETCFKLH